MNNREQVTTAAAAPRPVDPADPTLPIADDPASVPGLPFYSTDPRIPLNPYSSLFPPPPPPPLPPPDSPFFHRHLYHGSSTISSTSSSTSSSSGTQNDRLRDLRDDGRDQGGGDPSRKRRRIGEAERDVPGPVTVHWGGQSSSSSATSTSLLAEQAGVGGASEGGIGRSRYSVDSGKDEDSDDDSLDDLLEPTPHRERLSYTPYQLDMMNGIYKDIRYPNTVQKQAIARRMGITREQVKVWFQNRRRKDVVINKNVSSSSATATETSASAATATATDACSSSTDLQASVSKDSSSSSGQSEANNDQDQDTQGASENPGERSSMLNPSVLQAVIYELQQYSDEKLKERKEKRKARGKRKARQAIHSPSQSAMYSSNQSIDSRFRTYDVISPPNRVMTTSPYLVTSANRFSHSLSSSAFSSPRDSLAASSSSRPHAWDVRDLSLNPSLSGGGLSSPFAQSSGYGGLGPSGLGLAGLASSSQTAGIPRTQNLFPPPVLSDLLSLGQHLQNSRASSSLMRGSSQDNTTALLPHSSLPPPRPGSWAPTGMLDALGGAGPSGVVAGPSSALDRTRGLPGHPTGCDPTSPTYLPPGVALGPGHPWGFHHPPPPPPQAPSALSLAHLVALNARAGTGPVGILSVNNPHGNNRPRQ